MRLSTRAKLLIAAVSAGVVTIWASAALAIRKQQYDARAIWDAMPKDCTEGELLAAMPVPPGSFCTSSRTWFIANGSGSYNTNAPPPKCLYWYFDTGGIGVEVRDGRVTRRRLYGAVKLPESLFDKLKRLTRLDRLR